MTRRFWLAALLALGGCASVITPPKPPKPAAAPHDLPEIPRSFALEQTTQRKVDHLKLRVYDTGDAVVRGSEVSSMKSWSSKVTLEDPAFLIEHPTQGLILFGAGAAFPARGSSPSGLPTFQAPGGRGLVEQLAADHVDRARVRWLILPDLRPEFTGALESFPNAMVVVDSREWRQARERWLAGGGGLDTETLASRLKLKLIDFSSAPPYGAFDHGVDLFNDGTIYLIDLSGATKGAMGLWASLDEGPVLLTGDASWILDNHQDLALPAKASIDDLDLYWRRLYEMKAMQTAVPRLVIFPAHDLEPLTLQPRPDVTRAP